MTDNTLYILSGQIGMNKKVYNQIKSPEGAIWSGYTLFVIRFSILQVHGKWDF